MVNEKGAKQPTSNRESLRQRLRKNKPDSRRHLTLLLQKSELEIDLENVITALRNNYDKHQDLPMRSKLLIKFMGKALQIWGTAQVWLDEIETVIDEYEKNFVNAPANLYCAKFRCLKVLSFSGYKVEALIHKALALETDLYAQINYQLELAMYYENTSQYQKMKRILDGCEMSCRQNPNSERQLARTWLYLGHYYFYRFQFDKAADHMEKSRIIFLRIFGETRNQEDREIFKLLNNCFHYLGRVYFARYDFVRASKFYIKAQEFLEKAHRRYALENDFSATAFYHLRLGQALEACQLLDRANYHYNKSRDIFVECENLGGQMHVYLTLANLIGSQIDDTTDSPKDNLNKRVEQIKRVADNAKERGYDRGYLESLLRLFLLYIQHFRIWDLTKLCFEIITNVEFYKFIFANPVILISKLQFAVGLYGMGPDHGVRLYHRKKRKPQTIITACPCPDPECIKTEI